MPNPLRLDHSVDGLFCWWLRSLFVYPLLVLSCTSLCAIPSAAQIQTWKLGGSGLAWNSIDSLTTFIDYESHPSSIQPVFFTPDQNVLSYIRRWYTSKNPTQLDYSPGVSPRIWRAADVGLLPASAAEVLHLVDGIESTHSQPVSEQDARTMTRSGLDVEWYTIDLTVPVPLGRLAFWIPPRGFRDFDGEPILDYIVPSFEVSIAEEKADVLATETLNHHYHSLPETIVRVKDNFSSRVELGFARRYARFVRFKRLPALRDAQLTDTFDDLPLQLGQSSGLLPGVIAEWALFAEGVPRRAVYVSRIVDLLREVNFGRLFWTAQGLRAANGEFVFTKEARTSLHIEVRSGRDPDPDVYHEYSKTGGELVISRSRYENLRESPHPFYNLPGNRASIAYDTENWTPWSPAVSNSQSPLRRGRYVQVRAVLESKFYEEFVRLDSLWIETASPLANRVVGEVALEAVPIPRGERVQVGLGKPQRFTCDIRTVFDGGERGFDAVRLRLGASAELHELYMGVSLQTVRPDSVVQRDGSLVVYLPQRVAPSHPVPLRLVFSTEIFQLANSFVGEVFVRGERGVPQRIEEGDASAAVASNSLTVYGFGGPVVHIGALQFSSAVITPNGDGANDRLQVRYRLLRLTQPVPVEMLIYSLSGRRVARIDLGLQDAGPQTVQWDGRDGTGNALSPGIYLLNIVLQAQEGIVRRTRTVAVAH